MSVNADHQVINKKVKPKKTTDDFQEWVSLADSCPDFQAVPLAADDFTEASDIFSAPKEAAAECRKVPLPTEPGGQVRRESTKLRTKK